jgi:DNA adenine methylase
VKWAGGKTALISHLIAKCPIEFRRYYEPFVGGGSLFFALGPKEAVLCDSNRWLVDCYEALRRDWRAVANALERVANTKDEYLRVRAIPPFEQGLSDRAAQFIYLNKCGFRGLFRVNRQGQFNVPYGAYDRPTHRRAHLRRVSGMLQSVELRVGDFTAGLLGVTEADFVYLDPPYDPQGGYADFNRYTDSPFVEEDHRRLAQKLFELSDRGVRWMLSHGDTPFIRDLFAGFPNTSLSARREINLKSSKRAVSELLFLSHALAKEIDFRG